MKKITCITAIALLALNGWAQYALKGTVQNERTKEPLTGAHVVIEKSRFRSVTDQNGVFTFNNLAEGTYTVKVSYLGFGNGLKAVDVKENTHIIIAMKESPILKEEVVISSTRVGSKVPLTYQDVSQNHIESRNYGQDLPLLLSGGISAVSTSDAGNGMGYTALRIRGTDMTRINVTLNGIPLNDPESHNVFWVDLPDIASSTENIQIQRGVGTSGNGAAAFGATINLLSNKLNTVPYGTISSSYGSYNSSRIAASFGSGLISNHWTMDGRISRLHSDGFIDRAYSDLFSYHVSGAYTDNDNILRMNILSGNEATYQAWDGIPGYILDTNRTFNGIGSYYDHRGKHHYYDNETDNYRQSHYLLNYSRKITERLYLNISPHYTKGKGYYEQYRDDEDLAEYGIPSVSIPDNFYLIGSDTLWVPDSTISTSDLVRRKWLDNDFYGLTYSLILDRNKIHTSFGGSWNRYVGRHYGKIIWSEISNGISPDHEWYRSKGIKTDFNVYAKTNYEIHKRLNVFTDIQVRSIRYGIDGIDDDSRDITQDHNYTFINPKAGLFIGLNSNNSAYLSLAVANREPNRDNFVDADPAKPLPIPERLYDLEAGHSFKGKAMSLNTNFYWMYYRDQLTLTGAINDVGAPVMENVPVSYRIGIELSSRIELPKLLIWNASMTVSRNKIRSYTEYVDNWDTWEQVAVEHKNTDLSFSPRMIANSDLHFNISKNVSATLISKVVGKQFIDNTQDDSRSIDAYHVHDLKLNYSVEPSFCKELTFSLFVNNFLNHEYESNAWVYRYMEGNELKVLDGFFPQAGIHFMANILLKL